MAQGQKQPDPSQDKALIPVKTSNTVRRLEWAEKIAAALALGAKYSGYESAFFVLMAVSCIMGVAAHMLKTG